MHKSGSSLDLVLTPKNTNLICVISIHAGINKLLKAKIDRVSKECAHLVDGRRDKHSYDQLCGNH